MGTGYPRPEVAAEKRIQYIGECQLASQQLGAFPGIGPKPGHARVGVMYALRQYLGAVSSALVQWDMKSLHSQRMHHLIRLLHPS